jgi:hypothetical protein
MGLYDFNILSNIEKVFVLFDKGINIATRKESGYTIDLYSLSAFYVEIWYDSKSIAVENIYFFKTVKKLDVYLENINPLQF